MFVLTGIDSEGHAANFVETEQIVLYEGAKASFVQVGLVKDKVSNGFLWEGREELQCLLSSTDTRFYAVLLEPETQPEVQTQTSDQQNHEPRKRRPFSLGLRGRSENLMVFFWPFTDGWFPETL